VYFYGCAKIATEYLPDLVAQHAIAFAMDNHDAASSMAQMLLHLHAKEAQLVLMFLHIVHAIALGW